MFSYFFQKIGNKLKLSKFEHLLSSSITSCQILDPFGVKPILGAFGVKPILGPFGVNLIMHAFGVKPCVTLEYSLIG